MKEPENIFKEDESNEEKENKDPLIIQSKSIKVIEDSLKDQVHMNDQGIIAKKEEQPSIEIGSNNASVLKTASGLSLTEEEDKKPHVDVTTEPLTD